MMRGKEEREFNEERWKGKKEWTEGGKGEKKMAGVREMEGR